MTGPAVVLGLALLIVFLAALALDWWDARRDWREWCEEHPEPPSRLDRMDRPEVDPWLP